MSNLIHFKFFTAFGWIGLFVFIQSCATGPRVEENRPEELYSYACRSHAKVKKVEGSVWMSVKSREASGQFPAQVLAKSPSFLELEVTNLLGGTEARIYVQKSKIKVQVPGKPDQNKKGAWGGIPLQWAPQLFIGQVPCPSRKKIKKSQMRVDERHDLLIEFEEAQEQFEYQFKTVAGKPWPEKVIWKKTVNDQSIEVVFEFSDPESQTRLSKRWEVRSRLGEIKLRWKQRRVE